MTGDLMNFDLPRNKSSIIKVIGVGGGGSNAVNHMFQQGIADVDFIVCNTDEQALKNSPVPITIQLGETLTQGRGAGNKPELGRQAAIESLDIISELLAHNTKMVFITAGMGGGTGTGAAPVIADEARELGILTVGIVTLPFRFEGKRRLKQAIEGLNEMRAHVDSLLVINNEKLREMYGDLPLTQAFGRADNILSVAAKGIAEIITVHGSVNVDFADVSTVMSNSGVALMGSARAAGENRAMMAIEEALNSPLLNDNDIKGAKNILLNIASAPNAEVRMDEIGEITDYVQEAAGMTADIIWGNTLDESLGEDICITIIATGFGNDSIPELQITMPPKEEKFTLTEVHQEPQEKEVVDLNTDDGEEIHFEVIDKSMPEVNSQNGVDGDEDEVIERFDLFGEPAAKTTPDPVQLDLDIARPQKQPEDVTVNKVQRPKVSYNNENDIDELENEPAFKRKNVTLDPMDEVHADEAEVSRFTLSDEEGTTRIREQNSFLHDNVD